MMSEPRDNLLLLPRPQRIALAGDPVPPDVLTREPDGGVDPEAKLPPQGYRLQVRADRVTLLARDAAGLFYGRQTLAQLRRQGRVPALTIDDWPDFPVRGAMLDISRDKVPTMQTLRDLVDHLAAWKINHLQLYTEHTFAYAGHEMVWRDASPMTPEQVRQLDAYCQQRHIELAPNQNCFGHLHHWLRHEPYRHLAEAPVGWTGPHGEPHTQPFSLCPTDPASVDLIADLLAQLLPNFASQRVNIGCDETFDLGQGRSRDAVEQRGRGQVYLDFVKQVMALAKEHGRQPMFWGDIVLAHPACIDAIPRDSIALDWWYEDNEHFEQTAPRFAAAGVPFWVCPGTSSWASLAGRFDNSLGNIRRAAEQGLAHGAQGLLVTDWGDHGRWQPWCISLMPLAYAAAVSWCFTANRDLDLTAVSNPLIFQDPEGKTAGILAELGSLYSVATARPIHNSSPLFVYLQHPDATAENPAFDHVTVPRLQQCLEQLDAVERRLPQALPADAQIIVELGWVTRALRYAVNQAIARCAAGGVAVADLPAETRAALNLELDALLPTFEQLWLTRNRPGGLADSLAKLRRNHAP